MDPARVPGFRPLIRTVGGKPEKGSSIIVWNYANYLAVCRDHLGFYHSCRILNQLFRAINE